MSKRTLCRTRKQWRYVGRSVLENLLPYIDNTVCSFNFRAPGCSSSNDLLDYLESFDLQGSAISRGAEPIIYRINGQQGQIPVTQVKAIDILGAGDILRGTFCHHTLTASFPKSLEMAAHRATLQPFLWHQGMDKY
ncbi:MAG: hypothetical protein HKP52_08475 [Desulfofustis sp.]|nr:hypothetical protein [Desulfofustis sp.]NNK14258.1 hypothetical protein [Desulfofustis sp.]